MRERDYSSAGFTLSLPVSRGQLLAWKAAAGIIEIAALSFLPAVLVPLCSEFAGTSYPRAQALKFDSLWLVGGTFVFMIGLLAIYRSRRRIQCPGCPPSGAAAAFRGCGNAPLGTPSPEPARLQERNRDALLPKRRFRALRSPSLDADNNDSVDGTGSFRNVEPHRSSTGLLKGRMRHRMIWYKAWRETRTRFSAIAFVLTAFCLFSVFHTAGRRQQTCSRHRYFTRLDIATASTSTT